MQPLIWLLKRRLMMTTWSSTAMLTSENQRHAVDEFFEDDCWDDLLDEVSTELLGKRREPDRNRWI